jgi:hypothetical protein
MIKIAIHMSRMILEGKLVAQSIDMRKQKQFLEMLGKAGLC